MGRTKAAVLPLPVCAESGESAFVLRGKRDGLCLDGRRGGVAAVSDGFEQGFGEVKVVKGLHVLSCCRAMRMANHDDRSAVGGLRR